MTTTSIAPAEPIESPPVTQAGGESRFLIDNIDWAGYKLLLQAFGDGGPRMSYLDGMVELMSPGPIHEQYGHILGTMVTILTTELNIPAKAQGSTTFKRRNKKRGLEPDRCFYLASLELLRGQDLKTLKTLPPPDLVIEIEVTSPLLDKLEIYAGLGVPEIWRHNADGLTILCLGPDGHYLPSSQSRAFPFLPIDGFRRQLAAYDPDAETTWTRAYWTWVREVVAPLYQP